MPLFQGEFTDGHALAGEDVGVLNILDQPTGFSEEFINLFAGVNFAGHRVIKVRFILEGN